MYFYLLYIIYLYKLFKQIICKISRFTVPTYPYILPTELFQIIVRG